MVAICTNREFGPAGSDKCKDEGRSPKCLRHLLILAAGIRSRKTNRPVSIEIDVCTDVAVTISRQAFFAARALRARYAQRTQILGLLWQLDREGRRRHTR